MKRIMVLLILAALIIGATAIADDRMTTVCPAFDLTGRALRSVYIPAAGEVHCKYRRDKLADECPAVSPKGWIVVGKVDARKNKDKVTCVYWPDGAGQ